MDRDELIDKFSRHEVETTEELLCCLRGPITTGSFRRLLLLFLRGHYSASQNYMDFDHLRCFTWDPDDAKKTLTVEYTHRQDDENPDNYPGVFVEFARTSFNKIAIGNFAGATQDTAGTHSGKESVADFEISHVAKTAAVAHDLAELTALALTAMATPLALHAGATGFEVMGTRTPDKKKPSPEGYYTVATQVQIKYTLAVTRSLESHRIRMISLQLQSNS